MKKDTRELLLDSAYKSFYKYGYQGANIASILREVGVNKGSMYHFFKSKKELSLAVIKERIEKNLIDKYTRILEFDSCIEKLFSELIDTPKTLMYGCPLNKMSQEMIYIDEDFKATLSSVYTKFENLIKKILNKNLVKTKENTQSISSTAQLIIASYEGALMIYHLNQDIIQYTDILITLKSKIIDNEQ